MRKVISDFDTYNFQTVSRRLCDNVISRYRSKRNKFSKPHVRTDRKRYKLDGISGSTGAFSASIWCNNAA